MPSVSAFQDENTNPLTTTHVKNNNNEPCTTSPPSFVFSATSETTLTTTTSSCVSLKRKRPPKIQIPSVLLEVKSDNKMRSKVSKIVEEDVVMPISYDGVGVGVFSKKGKKKVMEDSHKIVSALNGNLNKGFYGVYDGHGGRQAVEFVAENLHENIMKMLVKCDGNNGKEEAVKAGYLKTDDEFLKQGLSSGTCCVTCLIEEKDIIVSNVGDCRAVLCRGGKAEALTVDHRAGQEEEQRRIEKLGGYVEIHRGAWRVHGILSVSRSIGDGHLKDWVLAEPDTKILNLTSDMDFIILASDGLWEKVGNQEAVDTTLRFRSNQEKITWTVDLWKEDEDEFGCENMSPPSKSRKISLVKQHKLITRSPLQEIKHYRKKPSSGGLVAVCKELVDLAVTRGSLDDITVMIIDLHHFQLDD